MKRFNEQQVDVSMVMLARAGDKESTTALWLKYTPLVLKTTEKFKGKEDDFDDMRQEAFLVLLSAIRNYKPKENVLFGAYLKKMLICHFLRKQEKRRQKSIEDAISLESLPNCGNNFIAAEEQEDTVLADRQLYAAIEKLPDTLRDALLDFYIQGKKQKEIAADRGLSENTVAKRIKRAIIALRRELGGIKTKE